MFSPAHVLFFLVNLENRVLLSVCLLCLQHRVLHTVWHARGVDQTSVTCVKSDTIKQRTRPAQDVSLKLLGLAASTSCLKYVFILIIFLRFSRSVTSMSLLTKSLSLTMRRPLLRLSSTGSFQNLLYRIMFLTTFPNCHSLIFVIS